MKSIRDLVLETYMRTSDLGMDLAPSDIGCIISLFLHGMAGNGTAKVDEWLLAIAAECDSVKDEQ